MAKSNQLLFLVDLYFGTGVKAEAVYDEIKKYCDETSNIIIESLNGSGYATLKISRTRIVITGEGEGSDFSFLVNPCDITWDTEIIDLSSKSKAEALKTVKSYVPKYGVSGTSENETYTCGCSI